MQSRPSLTLFAHVASLPDAEMDLAQAALLIAESEYPRLDMAHYMMVLDELARGARQKLDIVGPSSGEERISGLVEWLYGEQGFRGNMEDYYDPRNSFLNDVLDRRRGIPITLALVLIEVAHRVGLEAYGISFPSHFLVRTGGREPIIIDPFDGRLLGRAELRALHERVTGKPGDMGQQRLLEPCDKRQFLFRMLNNLRNVYASRGDRERQRLVLEHMVALAPTQEIRTELERLGGGRITFRSGGHALN